VESFIAVLLGTAIALAAIGIYLLYTDHRVFKHRKARLKLLASARPWSAAAPGELARLSGFVEAVGEPLIAPISGKRAAWHHVRGYHMTDGGRSSSIVDVSSARDFVVRGDEGAVTVAFAGEPLGPEAPYMFRSGEEDDAPPRITQCIETGAVIELSPMLRGFLAARNAPVVERDGFGRQYGFDENLIEVGSTMLVVALKPAGLPHGAGAGGPFRGDAAMPPVVSPALLASTEDALRIRDRAMLLGIKGGFAFFIAIGPCIALVGALMDWWLGR
jgi:hypothetical protein